jgi:hypothetical protein
MDDFYSLSRANFPDPMHSEPSYTYDTGSPRELDSSLLAPLFDSPTSYTYDNRPLSPFDYSYSYEFLRPAVVYPLQMVVNLPYDTGPRADEPIIVIMPEDGASPSPSP